MEQCIKCNKEFKIKDLFRLMNNEYDTVNVCKRCIKKHKRYELETIRGNDDMNFVFADTIVHGCFVARQLIGYYYSCEPSEDKKHENAIFAEWLTTKKQRKWLLRESMIICGDENEEALY